jgi:hypothetical protein
MSSDMSDVIEECQDNAQTTEPTPSDGDTSLRCHVIGCPEQQLFSTKFALKQVALRNIETFILTGTRRHQDKHIRPYSCHHASCNGKSFGDKGGFERHKREVHGSQAYKCPVLSCKRHKRGFNRRYNLLEHQKRAHSAQPSGYFRASYSTVDEASEGYGSTPTPEREIGAEAMDEGEVESAAEMRGDVTMNSRQEIRAKLRALLKMRTELDEDIRSMERALSIMGGESP